MGSLLKIYEEYIDYYDVFLVLLIGIKNIWY